MGDSNTSTLSNGHRASTGQSDDLEPGVFKPALPTNTEEVVRLFAIAGRAVLAVPENIEHISQVLGAMTARLVPPERLAAEECAAIWGTFMRLAQHEKEALRKEAGRALCRDLYAIAHNLNLPPMPAWESLPVGLVEPGAIDLKNQGKLDGATLLEVKAKAKAKARKKTKPPLKPDDVLRLLKQLSTPAQNEAWEKLVGDHVLTNGEATMLSRNLGRAAKARREDTALTEALEQVGYWLIDMES